MGVDDQELDTFFALIESYARKGVVDAATRMAPDHVPLARLLVNLQRAKRLLDMAAMYVEDELVKAMPGKLATVDGLGELEQHTGSKRTQWDKEGLLTACQHSIADDVPTMVDPMSGEMIDQVELVGDILMEFTKAATPSWKVTGLRALHIDPDDYCATEWGRKTIQFKEAPNEFVPIGGEE